MYSIYKINSKIGGNCYVGGTTLTLKQRFSVHKTYLKRHTDGRGSYISSIEVCKYPDAEIELLEQVDGTKRSKIDQLARERELMRQHGAINKNKPGALLSNPKYHKDYYRANKRLYSCECGSMVVEQNRHQHFKTDKHKNFVKNQ